MMSGSQYEKLPFYFRTTKVGIITKSRLVNYLQILTLLLNKGLIDSALISYGNL